MSSTKPSPLPSAPLPWSDRLAQRVPPDGVVGRVDMAVAVEVARMPLDDREQLVGRDVAQLLHDAAGRPLDRDQVDQVGIRSQSKVGDRFALRRKLLLSLISWTSFLLGKARSGVTVMKPRRRRRWTSCRPSRSAANRRSLPPSLRYNTGVPEVVDDEHVEVAVAVVVERQQPASLRRVGHAHVCWRRR